MPAPVDLPTLDPGVTLLRPPEPRSAAVHRLALATLAERTGVAYWVDARNVASTYTLYDIVDSAQRLRRLRVARAFTAYQHHALGRRVVERADGRTGLLVAPNVASLYRDDDVPAYERDELYAAAVTLLAEVGTTHDIPVLVTTDASGVALPPAVADDATHLSCERTRMGLRYAGADVETQVYVKDGFWQTTIPYWVELFGAASAVAPPTAQPARAPALDAWR
jgi:hypothetical protein